MMATHSPPASHAATHCAGRTISCSAGTVGRRHSIRQAVMASPTAVLRCQAGYAPNPATQVHFFSRQSNLPRGVGQLGTVDAQEISSRLHRDVQFPTSTDNRAEHRVHRRTADRRKRLRRHALGQPGETLSVPPHSHVRARRCGRATEPAAAHRPPAGRARRTVLPPPTINT